VRVRTVKWSGGKSIDERSEDEIRVVNEVTLRVGLRLISRLEVRSGSEMAEGMIVQPTVLF
jgi:hypothetical protein